MILRDPQFWVFSNKGYRLHCTLLLSLTFYYLCVSVFWIKNEVHLYPNPLSKSMRNLLWSSVSLPWKRSSISVAGLSPSDVGVPVLRSHLHLTKHLCFTSISHSRCQRAQQKRGTVWRRTQRGSAVQSGIFWEFVLVYWLSSSRQTGVPMLDPVKVWPLLHSTHISLGILREAGTGQQSVKFD